MHYRLKVEKPGEIEFTLTATMKADEWEKLRDQLDKIGHSLPYPAWTLNRAITDMLAQARKIYWPAPSVTAQSES